jgi:hypothetical protein
MNWDDLVKIVPSSPRFEFYFFNSLSFPRTKEKKILTQLPQEDRDRQLSKGKELNQISPSPRGKELTTFS